MSEETVAMQAAGLVKTYPGKVRALDGLSFSVTAGTVFALLGPNGAGKTTTVRVLTTLSRPDAGQAVVAGADVGRSAARVRSLIGTVGQHSGAVPQLTGWENLAMQGKVHGMRGTSLRPRMTSLLEQFDLGQAAHRPARTYSGGMLRRLDIAMALVHRPAVLFLDEPTAGLDPAGRATLWALLTAMVAGSGMTVMVTTHYLEEADQFAARVAIVDRGRIVTEGTPHELKAGLHGDSVVLELGDPGRVSAAEKALADVAEVAEATVDGTVVRARVSEGPRALPAVLAGLEARGVAVQSVTVARPTLDDVYLHHAGRTFRQAEGTAQS